MANQQPRSPQSRNWRSLSISERRSFHTVLEGCAPHLKPLSLILADSTGRLICIVRVVFGKAEVSNGPQAYMFQKPQWFYDLIRPLKTAYQSLLLWCELSSSILPDGYDRIATIYSPEAKNHTMTYPAAWEKWASEHPGKQPFVDFLGLVDNNYRIIAWNVSPNSASPVTFSPGTPFSFLEYPRLAVVEFNYWLKKISEQKHIIVPGYFLDPYLDVVMDHKEMALPVINI